MDVTVAGAQAMLHGPGFLPALLGGLLRLRQGARGSGAVICEIPVFSTSVTVTSAGGGTINFSPSGEGLVFSPPPTWAELVNAAGATLAICDARLSSDPDTGQEAVVQASSYLPGSVLHVTSATVSF